MLGRVVHRADFERLLASPSLSRSAHFAVHHVTGAPRFPGADGHDPLPDELSTSDQGQRPRPVDDLRFQARLGVMVPKRHARRAVTRNLIKRLARAVFAAQAERLPRGLWLLRLRAPFAPRDFVSAHSRALAQTVRDELERLVNGLLAALRTQLAAPGPAPRRAGSP